MNKSAFKQTFILFASFFLGILLGKCNSYHVFLLADIISTLFMNVLKLIGIPLIFFSIISTLSSFKHAHMIVVLGGRVLRYTIVTTLIAALIGLGLYLLLIHQNAQFSISTELVTKDAPTTGKYISFLINLLPNNMVKPFLEGNVMAIFVLASLIGSASLSVSDSEREFLHKLSTTIFSILLKIAKGVMVTLPVVIIAFSSLLIRDLSMEKSVAKLAMYLTCILSSNLIQGIIVLPLFLKVHRIPPLKMFKGMLPALITAFFSKSSSATLPLTMELSEEKLHMTPEVSRFSFPLCSVINMNGCAAFILITVLYVCRINHIFISYPEMLLWVVISSLAAIGNAGVPMGCYFLSAALLSSMNVPMQVMGIILPFYTFLDMVETALNVWSDSCVTAIVDKSLLNQRLN